MPQLQAHAPPPANAAPPAPAAFARDNAEMRVAARSARDIERQAHAARDQEIADLLVRGIRWIAALAPHCRTGRS